MQNENELTGTSRRPQIKICGLTDIEQARACAELGADAVGLVFFPKSPRNVSLEQARAITAAVPREVVTVGVFVNPSHEAVMTVVSQCGLGAVQLHGRESPELTACLAAEKITVIKALFIGGNPSMETVDTYSASAFLVECSGGKLPGGNALTWDWKAARAFGKSHPLVLAGGLSPDNVRQAIADAEPDAVDVSSGVEAAPGKKDLVKVADFISAVSRSTIGRICRPIFKKEINW